MRPPTDQSNSCPGCRDSDGSFPNAQGFGHVGAVKKSACFNILAKAAGSNPQALTFSRPSTRHRQPYGYVHRLTQEQPADHGVYADFELCSLI